MRHIRIWGYSKHDKQENTGYDFTFNDEYTIDCVKFATVCENCVLNNVTNLSRNGVDL